MIRPTFRVVWLLAFILALYLGSLMVPALLRIGLGCNLALLLLWLWDGLAAAPPARLRVQREHPTAVSQGESVNLELTLENPTPRAARLAILDDHPEEFEGPDEPLAARVPRRSSLVVRYRLVSHVRGPTRLGPTWLRSFGPLGLAFRQATLPVETEITVHPMLGDLSRFDLLLARAAGHETGEHRARHHYEGSEFTSLRDYNRGDDLRLVSWKHTARRGKLILREFEPERRKNVMLMIDAGRMMTNRIGPLTRLDHAVNTAVHLARIALAKGDRVGLLGFGQEVRSYLPPRSGKSHLSRVVRELSGLTSEPFEPDYLGAFDYFSRQNHRRTLIFLFTEILDPESSRLLLVRLRKLVPLHLPCCVILEDGEMLTAAEAVPENLDDAYRRVVAADLVAEKRRLLGLLLRSGAQVVHVPADRLALATLSRYLEIKRRGVL